MYLKTIAILIVLLFGAGSCLDLDTFYNYVRDNSSSDNPECEEQKAAFLQGLVNKDRWAIRMLDAFGRIPEGIAQGNNADLGMFDQCLSIAENLDDIEIKGKYCYGGFIFPLLNINLTIPQMEPIIKRRIDRLNQPMDTFTEEFPDITVNGYLLLAACIPNACKPSELFGELGLDISCQTKNETKQLEATDIACLCFFVIIALFIIVSTSYDYYLERISGKPKHDILLAFSFYTNGKKLLKTNQDSGQILFFNGMKSLSMFWVIMGHRYGALESLVSNKEDATEWRRKWYAVYVLMAPLAVDTFLFISGALLAYTFLKTMRKPNQKFNIGLYYLHRYLRLSPALIVLYIFELTLSRRIYDGPMYPLISEYTYENCVTKNWWSFFLYLQNYVTPNKMCMIHSWYLSVDMQLYIISPLLLLPMHYYGKRVIYVILPILTLLVTTYTILIIYFYVGINSNNFSNMVGYATHTRSPPWLIGLIFGAFLLDYQQEKQKYLIKSRLIILVMWGITVCVIGFLFFYQDDVQYNETKLKLALYYSLQKPLWTLCLCWISYACLSGNAGIINSFLSIPTFQILSKITYSTYLLHITVLMQHLGYMRTIPYFTDYEGIRIIIADIIISCFAGALWTLAFESPVLVIEKVIFGRKKIEKPTNSEPVDEPKIESILQNSAK